MEIFSVERLQTLRAWKILLLAVLKILHFFFVLIVLGGMVLGLGLGLVMLVVDPVPKKLCKDENPAEIIDVNAKGGED